MRQEVRETQFEHDLSLQASQYLNHWEQNEAATYPAHLNVADSQWSHATTRHLLEVEEQAIHHIQHFREGLAQDEQAYRATIQHEARLYSESLQQELQYHMSAQAQAESLLAAERQSAQTTLDEQANQWEAALHQVTEMAEEAVEQERTKTVEAEVDTNVFRLELQESQQELQTWDDRYNSGVLPEAETSEQQEDFHSIAGEQPASLPAISELLPGASPLTPPVVQHTTLQSRHLPPSTLPFSDISARAAETQRAEEISQEQAEARRVLQQAELSASQTQLELEEELQQARHTIQLLEESQVGSGAPSLTPNLTPHQGCTSHLKASHPIPATPANLRRPWAATRERLQQSSLPLPVIPSNCLSAPSSSGLPSLCGALLVLSMLHQLLLHLIKVYLTCKCLYNLLYNQLHCNKMRERLTSRGKNLLYQNSRSRVGMLQALQEQFTNGFNAHLSLLILGLRVQCSYGVTQLLWPRLRVNNGLP